MLGNMPNPIKNPETTITNRIKLEKDEETGRPILST